MRESNQTKLRRCWHYVLSYGVSFLFILILLYRVNWSEVVKQMLATPWYWIALALLALAISYALRILRWLLMLRVLTPIVRYQEVAAVFVAGMAFNNVLPLRAGDVLRLFAFRQYPQLPPARIMGTLVVERLLDLVVILSIFYLTLAALPGESIPAYWLQSVQWLLVLCVFVIFALFVFSRSLVTLLVKIEASKLVNCSGWLKKTVQQVNQFVQCLLLIRSGHRLWLLLLLSILAWSVETTLFVAAASAVAYQGSWVGPYFAFALGTLATTLPSSPGYAGTFDYFTAMGLHAFGISLVGATAFAFLAHLFLGLPVTLVGLGCYWNRRQRGSVHATKK